jgi:hypothetical protein
VAGSHQGRSPFFGGIFSRVGNRIDKLVGSIPVIVQTKIAGKFEIFGEFLFSTLMLSALNDRRQFFLLYFYVCLALQVKPCSSLAVSSRLSVNVPSE